MISWVVKIWVEVSSALHGSLRRPTDTLSTSATSVPYSVKGYWLSSGEFRGEFGRGLAGAVAPEAHGKIIFSIIIYFFPNFEAQKITAEDAKEKIRNHIPEK